MKFGGNHSSETELDVFKQIFIINNMGLSCDIIGRSIVQDDYMISVHVTAKIVRIYVKIFAGT